MSPHIALAEHTLRDDLTNAVSRIKELEAQLASLTDVLLHLDNNALSDNATRQDQTPRWTFVSGKQMGLFEDAPIGIYVSTPGGKYVRINLAMARLLGYASSEDAIREIVNIAESTYVHPGDRLEISRLLQEHGQIINHEVLRKRRDGTTVWVSQNMRVIKDVDGKLLFFVGYAVDINSTKLAEEGLQIREQELSDLYNYAPIGIVKSTPAGKYLVANDAMGKLLGYESGQELVSEIKDMAAQTYYDPHDRDKMRRLLDENGHLVGYELRRKTKYGSPIWLSHNWRVVRDANGDISHYEGFALDISERKTMEIRFREEGAIFRAILRGINAGIITIDPQTDVIVDINSVAAEIIGRAKADLKGNSSQAIAWICAESNKMKNSCLLQEGKRFFSEEMLIVRQDGVKVPVLRSTIPAHRGGKLFIFEVIFDISNQKSLERQLLLAQKLESIGQLAAGVAHEINTPIQYVGDNLQFIQESFTKTMELLDLCEKLLQGGCGAPDTPQECQAILIQKEVEIDYGFLRDETPKALGQTIEGINRVATIVSAMKKFSHPGIQDKSYTDINVDVENTVIVTRNEWKYVAEVEMDLDRTLPHIYCHPMEINQVIVNIVVNAAHAIGEKISGTDGKGRIIIRTSRAGNDLKLSISDTGCGIPEAHQKKIFDPFFTTKDPGKGTGQGLAMAHHIIVDNHQGSIDFETTPGVGTTFHILLPLEDMKQGGSEN